MSSLTRFKTPRFQVSRKCQGFQQEWNLDKLQVFRASKIFKNFTGFKITSCRDSQIPWSLDEIQDFKVPTKVPNNLELFDKIQDYKSSGFHGLQKSWAPDKIQDYKISTFPKHMKCQQGSRFQEFKISKLLQRLTRFKITRFQDCTVSANLSFKVSKKSLKLYNIQDHEMPRFPNTLKSEQDSRFQDLQKSWNLDQIRDLKVPNNLELLDKIQDYKISGFYCSQKSWTLRKIQDYKISKCPKHFNNLQDSRFQEFKIPKTL